MKLKVKARRALATHKQGKQERASDTSQWATTAPTTASARPISLGNNCTSKCQCKAHLSGQQLHLQVRVLGPSQWATTAPTTASARPISLGNNCTSKCRCKAHLIGQQLHLQVPVQGPSQWATTAPSSATARPISVGNNCISKCNCKAHLSGQQLHLQVPMQIHLQLAINRVDAILWRSSSQGPVSVQEPLGHSGSKVLPPPPLGSFGQVPTKAFVLVSPEQLRATEPRCLVLA